MTPYFTHSVAIVPHTPLDDPCQKEADFPEKQTLKDILLYYTCIPNTLLNLFYRKNASHIADEIIIGINPFIYSRMS